MKLFTMIFRQRQRLESNRKRPRRSLAMSFAALEPRALLTTVGPISLTAASAAIAAYAGVAPPHPAPGFTLSSSGLLNFNPGPPGGGGEWDGGHSDESPGPLGSPTGPPFDRFKNHVSVSQTMVAVNGTNTPEFALADAGASKVLVRYGNQVVTLGPSQGIDHPQAVVLAYLNPSVLTTSTTSYPDLIVVNSGGNNVLVFPGLAGGQFGPSLNGIKGFSVGQNPVSVTLADANGDGVTDLLIANQGSNTVSILQGQTTAQGWGSNAVQTIAVGNQGTNTEPVKALFADPNKDGIGDLVILNSGTDDVYDFRGTGLGTYQTNPIVWSVGLNPIDMLIGQFGRHQQLDLVTVNSGSDTLTYIGGVFTATPIVQTVSSGGIMPDAAFAFPVQNGLMDLVVANSGDGHLTILQAGGTGLQIAGILTTPNLPNLTSLAPGASDGTAINFIAATAGQEAAELLSFDLGISSTYLPAPLTGLNSINAAEGELIAGLMPFGDSSLELIAVYWAGSADQSGLSEEWSLREPSLITALYSPTEGQGETADSTSEVLASVPDPQNGPIKLDLTNPPQVNSFVTGFDLKQDFLQPTVEAVALRDREFIDSEATLDQFARLDRSFFDSSENPDDQFHQGLIGEALRIHDEVFDDPARNPAGGSTVAPSSDLNPARPGEKINTSDLENRIATVPLVSSVILLSTRLIFKARPPRPPSFRRNGPGNPITPVRPEAGPPS